jgi:hypothetical protein
MICMALILPSGFHRSGSAGWLQVPAGLDTLATCRKAA